MTETFGQCQPGQRRRRLAFPTRARHRFQMGLVLLTTTWPGLAMHSIDVRDLYGRARRVFRWSF